jgi:hypothetical protein
MKFQKIGYEKHSNLWIQKFEQQLQIKIYTLKKNTNKNDFHTIYDNDSYNSMN